MRSLAPETTTLIRDALAEDLTSFSAASLEKDLHISSVLKLIGELGQEHYSMVFCGGTSLIKAHRIINRMSEDIDFKIILGDELNTSARRKVLKQIKTEFLCLLGDSDVSFIDYPAENNNSHFHIDISYESSFERTTALRPVIKVEFTHSTTALPIEIHTATALLGDVDAHYLNPVELECLSLEETLAEKVVSYLRRNLPAFRNTPGQFEPQLVRHIYDVHMLSGLKLDLTAAQKAARHAYTEDAKRYANKSPEFAQNPRRLLLSVLTNLDEAEVASHYEEFVATLVNGDVPEFDKALSSFVTVARQLLN
ncbi:putative nucleotidyltransferase component of viral defense system [Aurantimicrobium minutum]|uniref:nucleotidyl transferase AbiEii/AbiGii toxin family protein n=1 Tax=Aurantimicrobium minutum TaxID=708131 RepID=UPI002406441D|nr:nucleotidyl transferase AbiEii/AbiGii toxin family protein [Aurantimicrobium minutum]MDF9809838.1 putative nucleotidyltransferase component of viral defense system [Aurantimicrobium minutum]